jgi:hypothetical protein
MKRNIYFDGQRIDRTDEMQMDCINTIGTTYDEAAKPENQELCTAISHLTGERINRFNHIPSEHRRPAQKAGHDPHAVPEGGRLHPALHGHRRHQCHLQRLL